MKRSVMKKNKAGDFPGGPVGDCLPMQGTQVQSLVGELKFHMH